MALEDPILFASSNGQNVRRESRQLKGDTRWSTVAGNDAVGRERQNHDSRTPASTLHLREWLQARAPNLPYNSEVDVPQVFRRFGKIRLPQLAELRCNVCQMSDQNERESELRNKQYNIDL